MARLFILCLLLCCMSAVQAGSLGVYGQLTVFDNSSKSLTREFENDPGVLVSATNELDERFNIEFAIGRTVHHFDKSRNVVGNEYYSGTLVHLPLTTTVHMNFRPKPRLQTSIGLGLGYYLNYLSSRVVDDYVSELNLSCLENNQDCEYAGHIKMANSLGLHFAGGLDYQLARRLGVSFSLRYRIVDADVVMRFQCRGGDCRSAELTNTSATDLGGVQSLLGLRFFF